MGEERRWEERIEDESRGEERERRGEGRRGEVWVLLFIFLKCQIYFRRFKLMI